MKGHPLKSDDGYTWVGDSRRLGAPKRYLSHRRDREPQNIVTCLLHTNTTVMQLSTRESIIWNGVPRVVRPDEWLLLKVNNMDEQSCSA